MKTYLIQRAEIQDRDWKKGIDSIIRLDYMGSAEFEWGALPDSLDKIRENLKDYVSVKVQIKDKAITVFCKTEQTEDIVKYLNELANNEMRLKEYSAFDSFVNDGKGYKSKTNFWWDIRNDLMFWGEDLEFQQKFETVINNKPI